MPDIRPGTRHVEVAVEIPLRQTFHYEWGRPLGEIPSPGARVTVPFGKSRRTGYVLREVDAEEVRRAVGNRQLKEVAYVVDRESLLTPGVLKLCEWMAHHYFAGLGETLSAALPGGVRKGRRAARTKIVEAASDSEALKQAADSATPKRSRALLLLAERRRLPARELCGGRSDAQLVRWLREKGFATVVEELRDPFELPAGGRDPGYVLTKAQVAAVERVVELAGHVRSGGGPPGVLLEGVTGSGKTEVYLRAIAHELAAGRQSIVLVPEIALTPQTVSRFAERFDRIAVLHSHLAEGSRAEQWRRIHRGEVDVVIGARSAVFAPVPALGLIVVDEEHEATYKQDATPRYHVRQTALARARIERAVAVLGSATPSLETYLAAQRGELEHARLPERIGERPMPPVEVVDMRAERSEAKGYVVLSRKLVDALGRCLGSGGQAILFLNRRGYSTFLHCPRCGDDVRCERCDVPRVLHKAPRSGRPPGTPSRNLQCHYCGTATEPPSSCPSCGFGKLLPLGTGTERLVDEVRRAAPVARIERMDSDAMSARGDYERVFDGLRQRRVDVLVGTQMIAKGLDLPRVTLVGVVNADVALSLPDFRSSERAFQLIAQVAGRTGRSELGGSVIVQTSLPESLPVRAGARHDVAMFASEELPHRREFAYPPYTRLARVVVEGPNAEAVDDKIKAVARVLSASLGCAGDGLLGALPDGQPARHSVLGPAEAPLGKLRGRRRQHLIVKAADDAALEGVLWGNERQLRGSGAVRLTVDVDPVNMR